MANKRYEYDMDVGTEKRGHWLRMAKRYRIGYIILFVIYVVVHAIIVMEMY